MKFKTRAIMRSDPDFELETLLDPMTFFASATGQFSGQIGEVHARVGRIPINVAIPFHPKRRMITVASIGGFTVSLKPMSIHIKECKIEAGGILGEKGLRAKMHGKVGCKTEMAASGKLSGKFGKVKVHLGDEDECDDDDRGRNHDEDRDHRHDDDRDRHHDDDRDQHRKQSVEGGAS